MREEDLPICEKCGERKAFLITTRGVLCAVCHNKYARRSRRIARAIDIAFAVTTILLILVFRFGVYPQMARGDINLDGKVDITDLSILADNFGK